MIICDQRQQMTFSSAQAGPWFNSKQSACADKKTAVFIYIILIQTSDNTADNTTKVFPKVFQVNID